MSDDSNHIGEAHRTPAPAVERHELERFASRHGISPAEARELFDRVGHDRDALEREAQRLRQL
jgi:VIT1/CCC1 family predicted Fe2+/Mn2+ transporter